MNKYSGTPSAGLATIYLANTFFQKKSYEIAEQYYQTYLDDYDQDIILSIAAKAGIAATYEERDDFGKAAKLYKEVADDNEDYYRSPEFLIRAARCYQSAKMPEAIKLVLDQLMEKFPKSEYIDDAEILRAETQS